MKKSNLSNGAIKSNGPVNHNSNGLKEVPVKHENNGSSSIVADGHALHPVVVELEPLFRKVLIKLGVDVNSEDFKETPLRHAKALVELCIPAPFKFTTFKNRCGYKEMILVKNIPYYSTCPHHLLQINGSAVVAYIPADEYVGLSKIPRTVTDSARGMKTQEQITMDIASFIQKKLAPKGVAVFVEGAHSCMRCRGTKMEESSTETFEYLGIFETDFNRRAEFLNRINNRKK